MKKQKNKFKAQKVSAYGRDYDSRKEAARALVLHAMEDRGEISDLREQVKFDLMPFSKLPSGDRMSACYYRADFVYTDANGNQVVEDVKGCKKGIAYQYFRLKKHFMFIKYGIEVIEI